jgi:hypothetical protein
MRYDGGGGRRYWRPLPRRPAAPAPLGYYLLTLGTAGLLFWLLLDKAVLPFFRAIQIGMSP